MTRPKWDEYFMRSALLAAGMATCLRRSVGAIVVINKRIVATGFNGPPSGISHCDVAGCLRQELGIPSGERAEICRAVHAEQNCIIQSSRHQTSLIGGTMYVTITPCMTCAKEVISAGIVKIVFEGDYPEGLGLDMLKEANVEMVRYQRPDGEEG